MARAGDEVQLDLLAPDDLDRLPLRVTVLANDGVYTSGAHAVLDGAAELELSLKDLQWLRDRGIPGAIAKLTELIATRGGS